MEIGQGLTGWIKVKRVEELTEMSYSLKWNSGHVTKKMPALDIS